VAKLLVSVRSAIEAKTAVAAGAAIVDVKEPLHGSLGRAPCSVWRAVREAVPTSVPISVALGELTDWLEGGPVDVSPAAWAGISYCKLGLAGAPSNWANCWHELRRSLRERGVGGAGWVGVIYIDWNRAGAPSPDEIIRACMAIKECAGLLFDTWDKSWRTGIDLACKPWIDEARASGRFVALAGGLDVQAIHRVAALEPDIIAVRGAACRGGDRLAAVDPVRVARLAQAVRGSTAETSDHTSNRTP
jgi:(5-formylfuran-3-yl)methyl phosphate synthase